MAGVPAAHLGDKFGKLTLIEDTGERTNNGGVIWKCQCECGNIVHRDWSVIMASTRAGRLISCGCGLKVTNHDLYERTKDLPQKRENFLKGITQIEGTTVAGIVRHKLNKNNKTGYRGVNYDEKSHKYRARLQLAGKHYEKSFATLHEAVLYRQYLEDKYYGPIIEQARQMPGSRWRDKIK